MKRNLFKRPFSISSVDRYFLNVLGVAWPMMESLGRCTEIGLFRVGIEIARGQSYSFLIMEDRGLCSRFTTLKKCSSSSR